MSHNEFFRRHALIGVSAFLVILGIVKCTFEDKVRALELPTATPTKTATPTGTYTATPTSHPGIPTLIAPANGALLPQPVSPNAWNFSWVARTGPCEQKLTISGPGGRSIIVSLWMVQNYTYQTDQYFPDTALDPWYWRVYVYCPLGWNVSETRMFRIMTAPITLTPTSTATSTPTSTPTLKGCPTALTGPTIVFPQYGSVMTTRTIPFDWTDSICATSYRLVVRRASASPGIQFVVDKSGLKHSRQSVILPLWNQAYIWRVAACNEVGCAWSGWNVFTVRRR